MCVDYYAVSGQVPLLSKWNQALKKLPRQQNCRALSCRWLGPIWQAQLEKSLIMPIGPSWAPNLAPLKARCLPYPPKTVLYLIVVGGEQPRRGMPGGAMPSGVKVIGWRTSFGGYARWKLRLTRNPERLANANGRCWKDILERKRSFKTHRPH